MELTAVELSRSAGGLAAHIAIPGGLLSSTIARELASAAESIREDRTVRVITVRATGGDFCSGLGPDVDVFELRPDPAAAIAALRPPVIFAVEGVCRVEGLELALAGDIRIGTAGSTYALDHIVEGRIPAWGGSQRLGRALSPAIAVNLAMLGTTITAADAKRHGLLYDISNDLGSAVDDLVQTLITRGPLALELTKEAVHRGAEMPLRDGLRLEGDLNHQLAASEDRAEGLAAFFEKRPPDFSGR